MGLPVADDAGTPAAAAPAVAAASAAAPAMKAPVPIPAAAAPEPVAPDSEWVARAKSRQKVPYWVMPLLIFLPVWLIMYVGTLEAPTREEGVIYEGGEIYVEAGCANCHGAAGAGGTGPAFAGGAIIDTFAQAEAQMAWVTHGSQGFTDAGIDVYGTNATQIGSYNGSAMPAFGADLTAEELIAVVFYERIELGGYGEDLALAELVWEQIESGEIELPEHFAEGPEGDFTGVGEIGDALALARAELAEEEIASE